MKKLLCLLIVGLACVSVGLFAQTFDGGGYVGPAIEAIAVADLVDAIPNEFVIVTGTLIQEHVPGLYVLADDNAQEGEEPAQVLVRIGTYAWSNLEIDDTTPVNIYGIVLKKYMNTEILALRVDLAGEPAEE